MRRLWHLIIWTRMIHPHTELRFVSPEIGYGVYATKDIPMGTITWIKDQLDRVISKDELSQFTKPNLKNLLKYTYRDRNGDYVFCWDHTRFINHSFKPNSILTSLDFEIAIRDIKKDEEITNDYGTLNIIQPFRCKRSDKSRKTITGKDLKKYYSIWDMKIQNAIPDLFKVNQPLKVFLSNDQKKILKLIKQGELNFPSILENYFNL